MAQSTLFSPPCLEVVERDQASVIVSEYIATSNGANGRVDIVVPGNSNSYAKTLLGAFLPAGYPQSVTKDYLEYQIYDSLQAFSSSIAGLLASRAVLEGVGVGDANASPTAALLLSVLQDSMGRIATIIFAHKLGTSLEPECKMYRLAADIFNDAAMILDCLSPGFPKASRVILLSFSSVLRALCGVAAGSSKASLSAHFATQGNLGELNAKDSSQETIISLLGMLAGSLLVQRITSPLATWSALLFLLIIHLGTNYLAVRAVSMRTLNRQRANIVFSTYLQSQPPTVSKTAQRQPKAAHPDKPNLLTPEEVSFREQIFERDGVLRLHDNTIIGHCTLGVPLEAIVAKLPLSVQNTQTGSYNYVLAPTPRKVVSAKTNTAISIESLFELFAHEDYVLYGYNYQSYITPYARFVIVLKESATTKTQLKSWFHALLCARRLSQQTININVPTLDILRESLMESNKLWDPLSRDMEQTGWDLEIGALETRSGTRISVHLGKKR